jgi:major histocompatibility complex class I
LQAISEEYLEIMMYFGKAIRILFMPGVVVHVFNPSTWEAEAGGFLSLRPAWSTE